ncbi:hypothetical protein diail_883 [Diaporthe ilicicola]|nr:hypothetical protein diail_883 [Diaporthe ilicicola]
MAPKASDQKRKRGRQPGASKPKPDASSHEALENDPEPDVEERARPKKRGRKKETEDSNTKIGHAPLRGKRKAATHSELPEEEQPESSEPRRSGRSRGNGTSAEVSGSSPTASLQDKSAGSQKPPKDNEPSASTQRRGERDRQGRQSDRVSSGSRRTTKHKVQTATDNTESGTRANGASQEAVASRAQQNEPAAGVGKKRRGRPSLNQEGSESARALQPQHGNRTKAPKKSSKADQPADGGDSIQEPSHPKRRGRPRQSDTSSQGPEQAQPSRSRGRPRRYSPEPADEQEKEHEQAPAKNKQKKPTPRQLEPVVEAEEEAEEERERDTSSEQDEEELPFRHLKESIKNIPRSVISEKWNALDGPSINAVGTFLADAQRPVLLRLQDTNRRREHASVALSGISRRLHAKLVKGLPFPAPTAGTARRAASGSYEDDFDFERTMNAVQSLENTLNPLLHSVSLLEREIKNEEDALAKDYDSLHKLEANAKSEAKAWREKAKREHVLTPGIIRKGDGGDYDDEGDRLELVAKPDGVALGGLFKDLGDEELMTLSKQIGSHMDSMQGNLQQIDGVIPAISRSKAALQQVVLKHLDEEQYDKLLLG